MFKVLAGVALIIIGLIFIYSFVSDYLDNKRINDAQNRLKVIKTEGRVLDIEDQVEAAEVNLKVRKDLK